MELSREQFLIWFRTRWQQGEHVAIIGPTGTGKTTLTRQLLDARDYVTVLAVKKSDDTLDTFRKRLDNSPAYHVIDKWPPPINDNHVVYWRKPKSIVDVRSQQVSILKMLDAVYKDGGWCLSLDDLSYLCDTLHLERPLIVFMNQGRSSGLSVVSVVQRPFRVPLSCLNQTAHIIIYPTTDENDVKRISELTGTKMKQLLIMISRLKTTVLTVNKKKCDFLVWSRGDWLLVRA